MTERKTIAIIDGHALAFRAYHAMRENTLSTSSGEPTFAIFTFCQILLTMLQERRPAYVAVSFDVGRTFRHDQFPDYKATRRETPEDFEPQLERIKQVLQALNIPIYTAEGFEADDVIGTLARQATAAGVDTLIVTGDTDTLQLVDEHVHVLLANPQRGASTTEYDLAKVTERYEGLRPDQLADLRGLKGDTSDNIPGVKGIGEKGAISLLNQFGNIEQLYQHLDEVPNRYRKILDGQQEQASFSKWLALIDTAVPVTLDLEACLVGDYNRDEVVRLFQELQFRRLLDRLPAASRNTLAAPPPAASLPEALAAPQTALPTGPAQLSMFGDDMPALVTPATPVVQLNALGNYTCVNNEDGLRDLVAALAAAPGFAFDVETTSTSAFNTTLVGVSLAIQPGSGYYLPLGHHEGTQLPARQVLDALRPFLSDPAKPKYAHHGKFDMAVLTNTGAPVDGLAFDTMIAAGLLGKAMGLKDLAFFELGLTMTPIEDLIGRGKAQITMDAVPIERATLYAAADADITLRLVQQLGPQLAEIPAINDLFYRLEMPLVPVLMRMEQAGIGIDTDFLAVLSLRLADQIAAIEERIYAIAERRFNINSGQQLNDVLFGHLKLPTTGLVKTKTGQYSLTAQTLEELRGVHEIIDKILSYRQLGKLKSTYLDALPAMAYQGRIHTSFNQMGAATGRLSSTDPNMQNIPIRSEEGREIRQAFVAMPGHRFVAADYSQIELRVLAHITEDPGLVATFEQDGDIHAAVAAGLFDAPPDQITKNQRRIAKTVVFGVIYGISSFGLASRLGMARGDAQRLIDSLFAQFPGVRRYIEKTIQEGRANGFVQTLFGRRRIIADLQSSGARRQAAEREAINAPIQGTSADLIKMAMVRLDQELHKRNLRSRLLLQVHDELLLEAPEEEVAIVAELVRDVMEGIYELRVPLRVNVEVGANWNHMQKVSDSR